MTTLNLQSFMKAKMDETDEHHLDPGQRAELVNTFIFHALGLDDPKDQAGEPLHWDLMCYSFQQLSRFAIQIQDENFMLAVKQVHSFMHSLHYSGAVGEEEFLGPARDEHERIWVERIEGFVEPTFPPKDYPEWPESDERWKAQYENKPTKKK